MKHMPKWVAAALAASSATMPLSLDAAKAEPAITQIEIRGIVPTICRVEFNQPAAPVSDNVVELGQMLQFCNNMEGYRIVVVHPDGLQGATLTVDGEQVPVTSGSETVLVDSDHPVYRHSDVRLQLASASTDNLPALSFRIEPKGMIF